MTPDDQLQLLSAAPGSVPREHETEVRKEVDVLRNTSSVAVNDHRHADGVMAEERLTQLLPSQGVCVLILFPTQRIWKDVLCGQALKGPSQFLTASSSIICQTLNQLCGSLTNPLGLG